MARIILGKSPSGAKGWLTVPNITLESYLKEGSVSYLDLYYAFGQLEFHKHAKGNQPKKGRTPETTPKRQTLTSLEPKVHHVLYFADQLKHLQRKILERRLHNARVHRDTHEQQFLAHLEGYLNTFVSCLEFVHQLDRELKTSLFSSGIRTESWYQFTDTLRDAMQHVASPLVLPNEKRTALHLVFEGLEALKVKHHKRFEGFKKGQAERFEIDCTNLDDMLETQFLGFLNDWARKHLERLDQSTSLPVITEIHADGTWKTRPTSLKDLMTLARERNPGGRR